MKEMKDIIYPSLYNSNFLQKTSNKKNLTTIGKEGSRIP